METLTDGTGRKFRVVRGRAVPVSTRESDHDLSWSKFRGVEQGWLSNVIRSLFG
jgi:hypothetical protein